MNKMTREDAWNLLTEYTETPALQQHALMVDDVMRESIEGLKERADITGLRGNL